MWFPPRSASLNRKASVSGWNAKWASIIRRHCPRQKERRNHPLVQTALATSHYFRKPGTAEIVAGILGAAEHLAKAANVAGGRGHKSYWRATSEIREVTLRHDLHALSLLFQFGQKHNWCRSNPVREVEIPSDKDATRCNDVTCFRRLMNTLVRGHRGDDR